MRLDDYLSTVGIIKRRTVAKELGANGLIEVNGRKVKPGYIVNVLDIIQINGSHPFAAEVLDIPTRSVSKSEREEYFKEIKRP